MLFNFAFITNDANGIPVSSLVIPCQLNGKRCKVKLLCYTTQWDTANVNEANQVIRLDFIQGMDGVRHATQYGAIGGANQQGTTTGLPLPTNPQFFSLGDGLEFECVLQGEQLTAALSRAVDPPYTASVSLANPGPFIYAIAYFDIRLYDE